MYLILLFTFTFHILIFYIVNNSQMEFVRVGVLFGEYEETIEGFIILHDRSLIEASWKGFDAESNIIAYVVGIGTHPGTLLCFVLNYNIHFQLIYINCFI